MAPSLGCPAGGRRLGVGNPGHSQPRAVVPQLALRACPSSLGRGERLRAVTASSLDGIGVRSLEQGQGTQAYWTQSEKADSQKLDRRPPKVVSHSPSSPGDLNLFFLLSLLFYCGKIHIA